MKTICQTPQMLIRELLESDIPGLSLMLSDPEVMRNSVRGVCDETATREFVRWCLGCYATHAVGPWALIDRSDGSLIGFCGVSPEAVGAVVEMNLGYRLARRFWGRGLATEAARYVVSQVFEQGLASSIVVIIEPEHVASLRVAEKTGFTDFSELVFHGKPVRLYRLTADRWLAQCRSSTPSSPSPASS